MSMRQQPDVVPAAHPQAPVPSSNALLGRHGLFDVPNMHFFKEKRTRLSLCFEPDFLDMPDPARAETSKLGNARLEGSCGVRMESTAAERRIGSAVHALHIVVVHNCYGVHIS